MIREIRYKISADTKSIEPKTRQWAGMQYEDNATEVVFDISALGITNALCRIDFNSAGAGYQPSENLEFKADCLRRAIPKHITQYGGEIQVTAVITVLDESGAVTGEALSWPVIVYLTAVDKSEEGSKEIEANISEIETSVRKVQEEVEETADKVAGMHHELQNVYLTADEIVEIKRDAEELIKDIETKLENGEFKGEKGDSGVYVGSGEMPEDCTVQIDPNGSAFELPVVDIVYSPTSPNAQSGIAVAEALANVGGGSSGGTFVTIANITLEEAVNSITIDETTFPDISKVKDFYIALSIAKPETVQSGNLLIKGRTTYAFPVLGVIKTWNNASNVMKGNFYSKYFDNNFRFNSCAETLAANNSASVNLATTINITKEQLQTIAIQCATATSLIPAGSQITIRGYIGK